MRRNQKVSRILAFLLLPVVLTGCVDSRAVTVRRTKLFAHKHNVKTEMHPKTPGEFHCAANQNTFWDFKFIPTLAVEKTKMIKEDNWYSITVKVKHVTVETSLPFDMWLPENASDSVIAHEDGHVRICKRFYRDAAHQARKCGLHILGREFVGEAKDEDTALKLAINAANSEMLQYYRAKIVEPADRASAAYDKLMADKSTKLSVDDAIEKAIADAR